MTRVASAIFSPCSTHLSDEPDCSESCVSRHYRYVLRWPTGLDNDRAALGIFANPSTADASQLDPTLTRWRNYCRDWGYGWAVTCNVMAWRSTDPKMVPVGINAVGPENMLHIRREALAADVIICGWGNIDNGNGSAVRKLLRDIGAPAHALKLTKAGKPCHPLYLRSDLKPFPMEEL